MNISRLTEERLRTWITDQTSQERMCISILKIDGSYFDVIPRRPKGGPDGARDIEAKRRPENEVVWGAVGFRHNVNDSDEDKKWVKKKFGSDVDSALLNNKNLWGFVFFTNMDLTPGEIDNLVNYAKEKGISFIDIFIRERLRMILDSPIGLALRYQHLGITMSETEQASFFSQWGSQLEALMIDNFGILENKNNKLEFLYQCEWPLQYLGIEITLNREYSINELGHFRFLSSIFDVCEPNPTSHYWIGLRDNYNSVILTDEKGVISHVLNVKSFYWFENQDNLISEPGEAIRESNITCSIVKTGGFVYKRSRIKYLKDLNLRNITFYATENLMNKISSIKVIANGYVISNIDISDINITNVIEEPPSEIIQAYSERGWLNESFFMRGLEEMFCKVPWPEQLTEEESQQKWVILNNKRPNFLKEQSYWYNVYPRPMSILGCWLINFSTYIPKRY